jgi:hypothetical protein
MVSGNQIQFFPPSQNRTAGRVDQDGKPLDAVWQNILPEAMSRRIQEILAEKLGGFGDLLNEATMATHGIISFTFNPDGSVEQTGAGARGIPVKGAPTVAVKNNKKD